MFVLSLNMDQIKQYFLYEIVDTYDNEEQMYYTSNKVSKYSRWWKTLRLFNSVVASYMLIGHENRRRFVVVHPFRTYELMIFI